MGLHIHMLSAEKLFGPVPCQVFHLVHVLASAVISCAGISFRILVGQVAAHRLHHRFTHEVFRGNQLYMIPLSLQLPLHGGKHCRVLCFHM